MTDPVQTFPERPLTKEEFLQRYILLRAGTVRDSLDENGMMGAARRLWEKIQEECKKK